jgi:hypothetical protein
MFNVHVTESNRSLVGFGGTVCIVLEDFGSKSKCYCKLLAWKNLRWEGEFWSLLERYITISPKQVLSSTFLSIQSFSKELMGSDLFFSNHSPKPRVFNISWLKNHACWRFENIKSKPGGNLYKIWWRQHDKPLLVL